MSRNNIYSSSGNSNEPIEAKKREALKQRIVAAFNSWEKRERDSLDHLMKVVLDFAHQKLKHLDYEFKEAAETSDDYAQEAAIKVWMGLADFEGTGETFYSWIHKICFNKAASAAKALIKNQRTKAPLMVPVFDDEGKESDELTDNPLMFDDSGYDGSGSTINLINTLDDKIDKNIALAFMTGVRYEDKKTGEWKTRAKDYSEVAAELNIPDPNFVAQRVKRMRDRFAKEREKEKPANLARWEKANNWKVPSR